MRFYVDIPLMFEADGSFQYSTSNYQRNMFFIWLWAIKAKPRWRVGMLFSY